MRRKALMLGAGLLMATAMASPAAAQVPLCVGTEGTIVLCVDPTGGHYISDCVYLGAPPCTQVDVYGPYVTCGGRFGSVCSNNT